MNKLLAISLCFSSFVFADNSVVSKVEISEIDNVKIHAEDGVVAAQNSLALMYIKGENTSQDFEMAYKWFTQAANQGYAMAQYNLGKMLQQGLFVQQNYTEALKWFSLAAEQGSREAQYSAAILYYQGLGTDKDFDQAFKLFSHSAAQGYTNSQYNLGVMYRQGEGVKKNYKMAYAYLLLAADGGNSEAIKVRDKVLEKISPEQTEEGNMLAEELRKKFTENE